MPEQHTPGLWHIQPMGNGCRILGGPKHRIVAQVPARREADARLVCAAPTLLAACEAVVRAIEADHWDGIDYYMVRDAVAQARGEG